MSDPAVRRPCPRSQQSGLLPRLQLLRIFKGPLNPKILTISVCTQYFARKVPTQYSKEALLFHQTKDPIFNSQFPWKPENIGSKTTQPSANSTSDLIPKRSELEETRYRKKQVHFENNHWTKKKLQNTRRETKFKKTKKIKLVEFYLQIKPPQNQKKTQVVKCRQENHNSNRRRREKKGKEAGAAATASIQGNVP
jgi:hypothetical protein